MKFTIADEIFDIFPDLKIGVILARGIVNTYDNKSSYQASLDEACDLARVHLTKDQLSDNDVIKVWRQAYQKFKTKKGARSSIEALLKRVSKGQGLSAINPLVDLYNVSSLKYGLPHGAEDLDTFVGQVTLALAEGGEDFVTLGSDLSQPPYAGEVVYKDEAGAICRCFNWRESVRTMITPKTSNAFICIESIDKTRTDDLDKALDFLKGAIEDKLSGSCVSYILDNNNKFIEI